MSSVCGTPGCSDPPHPGQKHCMTHHKEQADYSYGLDADIAKKYAAKYDVNREREALSWVSQVVQKDLGDDFHEALKDGSALCQLINRIRPGSVKKINSGRMPFILRENISNYLEGCRSLGMAEVDLFVTQDLFEGDNLIAVIDNLFSVSALSRKVGFGGPFIGVQQADKNVRNFSAEVLSKGKSVLSRQTQGSKGYEVQRNKKADQIIKDPNQQKASNVATQQTQGSYGFQVERGRGTDHIIRDPNQLKASAVPTQQTQGSYGYQPKDSGAHLDHIIRDVDHLAIDKEKAAAKGGGGGGGGGGGAAAAGGKFCGECGKRSTGGKFCSECGSPM